ncbi:TPA: hypothetical protein I8P16_004711 [Salmonella enterica subsp. enterica serovar Napoli]|nr:hypothetical protein [Salmonella enterica subsp. enterica serovar Napoli]HBC0335032.1 hypothetical protein [Salmonella enterica subsp. enterica serovar Napoli]
MPNLFDSLNATRRLVEMSGAALEKSKRYPQGFAIRTTPPVREIPGEIEITVCTHGLRRRVRAARVNGCTVYWEDGA